MKKVQQKNKKSTMTPLTSPTNLPPSRHRCCHQEAATMALLRPWVHSIQSYCCGVVRPARIINILVRAQENWRMVSCMRSKSNIAPPGLAQLHRWPSMHSFTPPPPHSHDLLKPPSPIHTRQHHQPFPPSNQGRMRGKTAHYFSREEL